MSEYHAPYALDEVIEALKSLACDDAPPPARIVDCMVALAECVKEIDEATAASINLARVTAVGGEDDG